MLQSRTDTVLPTLDSNFRDNRLLAAMPPDVLLQLEVSLRQMSFEQGRVLFERGDSIGQVYFPLSGMVSLLVVTRDGATLETSSVGREGAIGLNRGLGERRSFTRATVQVAGDFAVIDAEMFERVIGESPEARDLIGRYTEILWAESQQTAACNAMHDASSRLCRWLLQSSDRLESDLVPLTQEFLSLMLGVRRTTLTLLAQALQDKGAIQYTRGKIRIIDRAMLEALTCECYRAVQQEVLPDRIGVKLASSQPR